MTNGFLTCWFLIPEQILWLDIPLIRLEVIFTFSIDFIVYWDTPIKYINNFLILTNTYDCTGYFLGFTVLENVVLLAFSSRLSWFWFPNKNTFWFLLGNWCSLNTVAKNLRKFFFERPVFLEEFQDEINSSKVSLHFNKTPNSLRQILQTYSEICFFCVPQKKSSRSSQRILISKSQLNLMVKVMAMWRNSCYSKLGSEIRM